MTTDDPSSHDVGQPASRNLSQLFTALRHEHRRQILTFLADADAREKAELILADLQPEGADPEWFKPALHHQHLPILEEAGYIEWDRETNRIRRGPAFEDISPVIELLRSNQDKLPGGWP